MVPQRTQTNSTFSSVHLPLVYESNAKSISVVVSVPVSVVNDCYNVKGTTKGAVAQQEGTFMILKRSCLMSNMSSIETFYLKI